MSKSLLVPIPRKMFPPPTTRATWTPSPTTSRISADSPARIPPSIPYACFPIRASPDSFSRIRRYDGFSTQPPRCGGTDRSPLPELLRHLGGQVVRPLLHPFADLEPGEGAYRDRGAGGLPRVRDELRNLPVGVLDEPGSTMAEIAKLLLRFPSEILSDLFGFPTLGLATNRLIAAMTVGDTFSRRPDWGAPASRGHFPARPTAANAAFDSIRPNSHDYRSSPAWNKGRPAGRSRRSRAREPRKDLSAICTALKQLLPGCRRRRQGSKLRRRSRGLAGQRGDILRQRDEGVVWQK